jgi:hypothetical protein
MLLSIGTAQWWVLRARVAGASRWIVGTAAAWLTGVVVFCLEALPLWHPGQSGFPMAVIGAVAGISMAATVAVVTGWVLVRLFADTSRTPRHKLHANHC